MSLILNIDTATETAQVSFAKDGKLLQSLQNDSQKDHASFLQVAIQQLTKAAAIKLNDIDAIAVTAGPGSYTGLRVGMSGAKGLCYALNKPLITLNTLEVLAVAAIGQSHDTVNFLYCPMIDARRMEVFTAIYSSITATILSPCAMILQHDSFLKALEKDKIIFFGSGADKWKAICHHPNASFTVVSNLPAAMSQLAQDYFIRNHFANLAYSEPFYLKEFQDKI
jgi:tRNA threonylcarbamoyladenosine biosynthesis protein TsaB